MTTTFTTLGITVEDDTAPLTTALWQAEMDYQGTAQQLAEKADSLAADMIRTASRARSAGASLNWHGINSLGDAQQADEVNRLCAVLEEQRKTCMSLRYIALKSGAAVETEA